jgi:hypothetical protein
MSQQPVVQPVPGSHNERLALNVGLKAGMGLAVSGLLSVIAFRSGGARLFMTGLGTGGGLGYAWCQNDLFLKGNPGVALPLSFKGEFDRYWAKASDMVPSFAKFK